MKIKHILLVFYRKKKIFICLKKSIQSAAWSNPAWDKRTIKNPPSVYFDVVEVAWFGVVYPSSYIAPYIMEDYNVVAV